MLQELPKCGIETRSKQRLWKNGTDRLTGCRVSVNLQFVKIAVYAKHNEVKHNKTRYASIPMGPFLETTDFFIYTYIKFLQIYV